jgi:transcriptional regulator with PAS, ATPase and Fis domain
MRRLASLRLHEGKPFEAVPLLKEAIAFAKRCEERFEIGIAYRHLARAYRELGQLQGAEQAALESIRVLGDMGAKLELAKSRLEAARACHAMYRTLAGDIDVATSFESVQPYNHLESAWTHAIEAFHGFSDLGRDEERQHCEELMDTMRGEGSPLWIRYASARPKADIEVNDKPFIANAPAMKQLMTMVEISASTDEPVLITGETGTGKELVARLIHDRSVRAKRAFVPVNCAAIPESLFEREFFGHARGAYTGADAEKPGLCEAADKGTLFLDEIGDMPAYLQVKLLRLLQEGTFHRLGDPVERRVNLRIVAATNAPLSALIADRRFRQDLYYRLQTLEMNLPPLRERPEDLEELVALFVRKVLGGDADPRQLFDKPVWRVLRNYPWPGNVRELEAMTRRLALLARHGGRATLDMLPEDMRRWKESRAHAAGALDLSVHVGRAERERISQALIVKGGNRSEAAKALGISRNQLYKKMEKLGIKIPV